MKRLTLLLTGLFLTLNSYGQLKQVRIRLFFDSDSYTLSSAERQKITRTLDSIGIEKIRTTRVYGNTDSIGSTEYNKDLSNKRVMTVESFLDTRGIPIQKTMGFGESRPIRSNRESPGRRANRRVDLYVQYSDLIPKKVVPDEPVVLKFMEDTVKPRPCEGKDTTFMLADGTLVKMGVCDWKKRMGSLTFDLANDPEAARRNSMEMKDERGLNIMSEGMVRIKVGGEDDDGSCFEEPIRVMIPVASDTCIYCSGSASLYYMGNNNVWYLSTNGRGRRQRPNSIEIDGRLYWELEVKCPNQWINCDCIIREPIPIKIQAPPGYVITRARISHGCPTAVHLSENKTPSKTVLVHSTCGTGEKFIEVNLIGPNGVYQVLERMPLNDLKKRVLFSKCRRLPGIEKRLLGFIPISKRELYRKYLISIEDLRPRIPIPFTREDMITYNR